MGQQWKYAVLCGLLVSALPNSGHGAPAAASPCTTVPRLGWISSEEIENHLKAAGYQLMQIRMAQDACYTATVQNSEGKRQEVRIHPVTSQVLGVRDVPPPKPARK